MMKTAVIVPEEQHFTLASLSPGRSQKRLALAVVLALLGAFFIFAGPLATIQLGQIDAFVPAYATAMFVSDLITAALLFGICYNTVIAAQGIWSSRVFTDHPTAGLAAVNTALTIGTLLGPTLAGIGITLAGYPATLAAAAAVLPTVTRNSRRVGSAGADG